VRDQKLQHGDLIQLAHTVSFRIEDPRVRASQRNVKLLIAAIVATLAAAAWWLARH
jgi:hypothetical protein